MRREDVMQEAKGKTKEEEQKEQRARTRKKMRQVYEIIFYNEGICITVLL